MSVVALLLIAQASAPEVAVAPPIGSEVAGPVVRAEAFELGRRGALAEQPEETFDPSAGLFDGDGLCVVVPGEEKPACARTQPQEITLNEDVFSASIAGEVASCQTIETIQRGSDGRPQRVFATVCGDDVQAWNFRSRQTPSSEANPTRATDRAVGPNEVLGPLRAPPTSN